MNTLTLPLSILTGDAGAIEKLGLRPEACPFDDVNCYWYPIEKAKTEEEMDSDKANDGIKTESRKISILYWPAQIDSQRGRPIIIAGAYEDNSTNLYYLLVPPAFVGDVVAAAAAIVVIAIAQCPYCFTGANH